MEYILSKTQYVQKRIIDFLKNTYKYLKENKAILILFFIYPIFLHYILKAILGIQYTINYNTFAIFIQDALKNKFGITQILRTLWLLIPKNWFYEYILILGINFILFGIVGKIKKSLLITTILGIIFSSANYFILQLRGTPLALADIFSIRTALNVAEGYTISLSIKYVISIIIAGLYMVFTFYMGKKEEKIKNIFSKIIVIGIGILLITLIINSYFFENERIWNLTESYATNGQLIMLLKQFDDINIKEPENYSKEKALSILNKFEENNLKNEAPNIVVVMNESFSDLKSVYNLPMEENIPNYRKLKENTIKGTMYSSTIGTGTSTIEWEFLTGNSSAFIPIGASAYLQYISEPKESLISRLNNLNYETIGLHSYNGTGYNRKSVYEHIQFKESYFLEDMNSINCYTLDYPDDNSTYQNFLEKSNNTTSKNKFGFIVTMQNHSPYNKAIDFVKKYTGENEIDNYLSLINKSDEAIGNLINYYKEKEEKTIIVFFGDHQPGFVVDYNLFEEKQWKDNYKVPFFIWANYDIEEKENLEISPNYLSILLTEVAGIENSQYMNFIKYIKEKIPVITANGYKGENGQTYEISDKSSPYYNLIEEYKIVEYYQMFDKVL